MAGLAALAAGCDDPSGFVSQVPRLELEVRSVDFGAVPLGATKRVELTLQNVGQQVLTVADVAIEAPFTVDLTATEIAAGGSRTVALTFSPATAGETTGRLRFTTNANEEAVDVALRGEGVQSVLRGSPPVVDFGAVSVGERAIREIILVRQTFVPVEGQIVTDAFIRPEHFELGSVPVFGQSEPFALAEAEELVLELAYQPQEIGRDDGRVLFELTGACGDACGVFVEVRAEAVTPQLALEPLGLDFGTVGLGESSTKQVVATNRGTAPILVQSLRVDGAGGEVEFDADAGLPVRLEPDGFFVIRVTYAPTSARSLGGALVLTTDEDRFSERLVPLQGEGAGPRFEVLPEVLQFGVVPDASFTQRQLLLINSGSSDARVERIELAGDAAFSWADLPSAPLRLASGGSVFASVGLEAPTTGTYTATVTLRTDDPASPTIRVPVRAFRGERFCNLIALPAPINFGVVAPGSRRSEVVRLSNAGTEACELLEIGLMPSSDPAFSLVLDPNRPSALSPGQEMEAVVTFAPGDERQAKGTVVVRTNDPVAPRATINLVASSIGYADIFTQPSSIDFGALRPDCNVESETVTLFNAGTIDFEVAHVELRPPVTGVSVSGPSTPVELRGDETLSWAVTYRPTQVGTVETDLVISFSDLPFPLRIPVRGEASPDARRVDEFRQRDTAEVDVLFVIDNSCSMANDQQALAINADAFIREADPQNVKFRIGITTTSDWPDQGRLVGPVIDSETMSRSDIISEFGTQARVGINGSGFEQGAASAVKALDKARRGSRPNRDLRRDDAVLAVFIVSDEDDSSPAPMSSYFKDLRRASSELILAVVSGGIDGCGEGGAFPAPRYQDLLRLAGGNHFSICGDWGRNLQDLGQTAFALFDSFTLDALPEARFPVEVMIDGVPVGSDRFSREVTSRVVVIRPAPEPLSHIEVSYVPQCQ